MKKLQPTLLICLLFLSITNYSDAQTLPMNTMGKIEATEIVQTDSLRKMFLFTKADLWSQALVDKSSEEVIITERDVVGGKIVTNYKFLFYTQSGIFKKVSGAVTYTITLEVKDFKYRYTFTEFVYHPYVQNRNYVMVDSYRQKKMEDVKAAGYQKTWNECKATTANKVKNQINSLKQNMIEIAPPPPVQVVEAKKSDW